MVKGDKVRMAPMWKYEEAFGTVKQIKKDGYIVVVWDNINGECIIQKNRQKDWS